MDKCTEYILESHRIVTVSRVVLQFVFQSIMSIRLRTVNGSAS